MPIIRKTLAEVRAARLTPEQKARLDAMTDEEITAAALSDPDNPPITEEEFKLMRRPGGRPQMAAEDRKVLLSLRLDREVVEQFRATGPGWQTRMGEVLATYLKRSRKRA
jgi:uncharacterized protein (DUF4415 family)